MHMHSVVVLFSALLAATPPASGGMVTNCAQMTDILLERTPLAARFDLRATLIVTPPKAILALADDSGATSIVSTNLDLNCGLLAGDRIRALGHIEQTSPEPPVAFVDRLERIARGAPPSPRRTTSRTLRERQFEFQPVSFRGEVEDVFEDEVDPFFAMLVLRDEFGCVYASIPLSGKIDIPSLRKLIGARIEANGICNPSRHFTRRKFGTCIGIDSFQVLRSPADEPFAVPLLDEHALHTPYELAALGRRRALGRVIAVWQGNSALLRTKSGSCLRIEFARGPLPSFGDSIEAVGYPATDLYRFNLVRAIWRPADAVATKEPPPKSLTARQILTDEAGRLQIKNKLHGEPVRLAGVLRRSPGPDDTRSFMLEDGDFTVQVDVSALAGLPSDLEPGCRLAVTGTCVMDIDNWRPNAILPRIRGFILVPRTADDIVILARPPWWTIGRLIAALGILVAVLAGISVWGLMLRRAVARKSRELEQEIIARVSADLKVHERTRLAVELHDSLSQTLTGVAMEIRSADKTPDDNAERKRRHLALAAKAVDACRSELRNCLWDLRNNALDEADMNEAIRRTVTPHLGDATLAVRFGVPRARFTDNTTHNLLRIVRELAVNAIRHGQATHIQVAGAIEGDKLYFSVRDNGTGFDPAAVPGPEQGHFGLQGIRERINGCGGDLLIASAPGRGAKVTITLLVPQEQENA